MSTDTEPWEFVGGVPTELEHELDRLSLAQAVQDFEVANARVVDLTHRLISASAELGAVRRELETLRREHREVCAQHDQMRGSAAFRLASRIWAIRNAL